MERAETKTEFIVRAKAALREDLRAKTWPEKVRAAARLNALKKKAQEAMRKSKTDIAREG